MKKIGLCILGVLVVAVSGAQQNVEGTWEGRLNVGATSLRLVFNIKKDSAGLAGTMDSPDQGAMGIKLDKVELAEGILLMEISSIGGKASGKLENDSTFQGQWIQGMSFPLELKKVAKASTPNRPQTPKPPFAYKTEDLIYYNRDSSIQFGATITIPGGKGPFPALLLISGSGQQNRDEELFAHKPFAVIADYLTNQGFVVLRVDDRGVGQTTGEVQTATSKDFADDVKFGLAYLKGRQEVAKNKIGLLGHSEGGMIAQMVAAEIPDIAFVVSLAGPGQKIVDLMTEQNKAVLKSMGISNDAVENYGAFYRSVLLPIINAASDSAAKSIAEKMFSDWINKTPKETVLATTGISDEKGIEQTANAFITGLRSPWFTYFLKYDPDVFIRKMKAKVLVLNGEKDIQVIAGPNLAGWQSSLAKSKVKKYDLMEMKGLNHLFQRCKACTIQEYGQLEETIAPGVLETIGSWLKTNIK